MACNETIPPNSQMAETTLRGVSPPSIVVVPCCCCCYCDITSFSSAKIIKEKEKRCLMRLSVPSAAAAAATTSAHPRPQPPSIYSLAAMKICLFLGSRERRAEPTSKAQTSAVNLLRARPLCFSVFRFGYLPRRRLRILHSRSIIPTLASSSFFRLGTYIGGIYVLHAQDIDTRNYRCAARPLMLISAEAVT